MNAYRGKLLNAVLFFAKKTKHVNLTKLSKLLYLLDFTHFKQTGYPSIGLKYYAFERGPVPKDFWLEIREGAVPDDFIGKIALIPKTDELDSTFKEIEIKAVRPPDLSVFTPRELKILEELAFIYKDVWAWQMSEISHLPKQPWDITVRKRGKNKLINYLDGIDDKSDIALEDAKQSLKEHFEVIQNLGIEPTQ